MTQRLESRTALVTGSINGIGKAIAEAFAAEGAHVIITVRRAEPGAEIVAKITGFGGHADFIVADLAQGSDAIDVLVNGVFAVTGGHLDILVNNVAYLPRTDHDGRNDRADDRRCVYPQRESTHPAHGCIRARNGGKRRGIVINMGSINGLIGMNGTALYSATKRADLDRKRREDEAVSSADHRRHPLASVQYTETDWGGGRLPGIRRCDQYSWLDVECRWRLRCCLRFERIHGSTGVCMRLP
jgi:hypothetical protein